MRKSKDHEIMVLILVKWDLRVDFDKKFKPKCLKLYSTNGLLYKAMSVSGKSNPYSRYRKTICESKVRIKMTWAKLICYLY